MYTTIGSPDNRNLAEHESRISSSTNAELRKIKKPIMEKKRRERINRCLTQLKSLVLEANNKEISMYARMEKADILEMAVEYMQRLKLQCQVTVEGSLQCCQEDDNGKSPQYAHDDESIAIGYKLCLKQMSDRMPKVNSLEKNNKHQPTSEKSQIENLSMELRHHDTNVTNCKNLSGAEYSIDVETLHDLMIENSIKKDLGFPIVNSVSERLFSSRNKQPSSCSLVSSPSPRLYSPEGDSIPFPAKNNPRDVVYANEEFQFDSEAKYSAEYSESHDKTVRNNAFKSVWRPW